MTSPERAAFERAIAEYPLAALAPPHEALAVAAASLERTGLFLLGETHGVLQTPCAVLGLVERLGVRSLAFEWAHDELDDVVQPVLTTGAVVSEVLWALPPSAEVFSGDGRFTAGHVSLLEHLGEHLDRIVLLDAVGAERRDRESRMVRRLLVACETGPPTLAVLGVGHVVRTPVDEVESVGMLVEREVSGVANGFLAPSSGTVWFHGERELRPAEPPPVDVVFSVGVASPAVVPRHPLRAV